MLLSFSTPDSKPKNKKKTNQVRNFFIKFTRPSKFPDPWGLCQFSLINTSRREAAQK